MSEENKTVELKDEELEKVTGGAGGKCGITIIPGQCQQYDSSNPQCKGCLGKPFTAEFSLVQADLQW